MDKLKPCCPSMWNCVMFVRSIHRVQEMVIHILLSCLSGCDCFFVTVEKIMFMWTRKTIAAHFDVQGRNFNSVKVCSFLRPALHCITMSVRVLCTCAEFCLLSKNKSDCCTLQLLAVCLPHTYRTTLHYHPEGKRTHQRSTFSSALSNAPSAEAGLQEFSTDSIKTGMHWKPINSSCSWTQLHQHWVKVSPPSPLKFYFIFATWIWSIMFGPMCSQRPELGEATWPFF